MSTADMFLLCMFLKTLLVVSLLRMPTFRLCYVFMMYWIGLFHCRENLVMLVMFVKFKCSWKRSGNIPCIQRIVYILWVTLNAVIGLKPIMYLLHILWIWNWALFMPYLLGRYLQCIVINLKVNWAELCLIRHFKLWWALSSALPCSFKNILFTDDCSIQTSMHEFLIENFSQVFKIPNDLNRIMYYLVHRCNCLIRPQFEQNIKKHFHSVFFLWVVSLQQS